ncbi:MAG TPA: hypothetical protein VFA80_15295 [Xanthobacteraceae bacterium]|nr:hypothetical protein [Xanthobacteraceae bacterium]
MSVVAGQLSKMEIPITGDRGHRRPAAAALGCIGERIKLDAHDLTADRDFDASGAGLFGGADDPRNIGLRDQGGSARHLALLDPETRPYLRRARLPGEVRL